MATKLLFIVSTMCLAVSVCFARAIDERCVFTGLPPRARTFNGVAILKLAAGEEFNLTCRCSIYSPEITLHDIVKNVTTEEKSPIVCKRNGNVCSPDLTYIHESYAKMDGLFVHYNFTVSNPQTTMIQCYNRFAQSARRQSLIVLPIVTAAPISTPTPTPSPTPSSPTLQTSAHSSSQTPLVTPLPPAQATVTITSCPSAIQQPATSTSLAALPITPTPLVVSSTNTVTTKPPGISDTILQGLSSPVSVTLLAITVILVLIVGILIAVIAIKSKHNKYKETIRDLKSQKEETSRSSSRDSSFTETHETLKRVSSDSTQKPSLHSIV